MFGVVAERLTFLRAIDAAETDTLSMVTVQDFEGVAIDYPNYSSVVLGGDNLGGNKIHEEERTRNGTQRREAIAFSGRLGAGDKCCILDPLGHDESSVCPKPESARPNYSIVTVPASLLAWPIAAISLCTAYVYVPGVEKQRLTWS